LGESVYNKQPGWLKSYFPFNKTLFEFIMTFSTFDVFKGNKEHIGFLSKQGYDLGKSIDQLHPATKSSILEDAIIDFKYDLVKILIEKKADINRFSRFQNGLRETKTPLHLSIFLRRSLAVQYLLDSKVDIEILDMSHGRGLSPMMQAATSGGSNILAMLLEAKADINRENLNSLRQEEQYMTPLMYAVSEHKEKEAIFLIRHGASMVNSIGKTVFDYCQNSVIKEKIQKYINLNIVIAKEFRLILFSQGLPNDLADIVCNYYCDFSFIKKRILSAKEEQRFTEPVDQLSAATGIRARVNMNSAVNIPLSLGPPTQLYSRSSFTRDSLTVPSISSNQFPIFDPEYSNCKSSVAETASLGSVKKPVSFWGAAFFSKKKHTLFSTTARSHSPGSSIEAFWDTSTRRCDCSRLNKAFSNFVATVFPRR
jgi:hypothetical protein